MTWISKFYPHMLKYWVHTKISYLHVTGIILTGLLTNIQTDSAHIHTTAIENITCPARITLITVAHNTLQLILKIFQVLGKSFCPKGNLALFLFQMDCLRMIQWFKHFEYLALRMLSIDWAYLLSRNCNK